MHNRRRHERFHKELKVIYHGRDVSNRGITHDICQGGLFIITSQVIPLRSRIDLEFLGDDGKIFCRYTGKVAWVNMGQVMHLPPGFGVSIPEISESDLNTMLNAGFPDLHEGQCA